MHAHYDDILSRIKEPPDWFDETGVPRWGPFAPNRTQNIQADESVLLRIACQGCGRVFKVAMTSDHLIDDKMGMPSLRLDQRIRRRTIEYGDPPNVRCCDVGAMESSIPLRVLEYWVRDSGQFGMAWRRDPSLEVTIEEGMS